MIRQGAGKTEPAVFPVVSGASPLSPEAVKRDRTRFAKTRFPLEAAQVCEHLESAVRAHFQLAGTQPAKGCGPRDWLKAVVYSK